MVRVIEGKIIQKCSEGNQKSLRVSGRFELSRIRVAEGKITVNVYKENRNRLWFELARVRVSEVNYSSIFPHRVVCQQE